MGSGAGAHVHPSSPEKMLRPRVHMGESRMLTSPLAAVAAPFPGSRSCFSFAARGHTRRTASVHTRESLSESHWGQDQGPVATSHHADRPEDLHHFFSMWLPPVPYTAKAMREGGMGGAPFLQGDSHSFRLTLWGKSFSPAQPQGSRIASPPPHLCTVQLQNRNPLPFSSPFPLHPYLPHFYLATIRVFLNPGGRG